MQPQRSRRAERAAWCLTALLAGAVRAAAQAPPASETGALRTFELAKPAAPAGTTAEQPVFAPARLPRSSESLRTTIGLGYVQGADWGSEIFTAGSVRGVQVQLNSLVTSGSNGLMFDHGSLAVFDPDRQWRVEAGDVFSHLRGAALGGRVSWSARGNRRPAIAVYAPRRGMPDRPSAIAYRDQINLRGQTLLDAEIASDRSYLLRSRLSLTRLEVEAFHRSSRSPLPGRDVSVSGMFRFRRGITASGGLFQSVQTEDRSRWWNVAVHLPVGKFLGLTLERAFSGTLDSSSTSSAVMASMAAGELRFFHRYQYGAYDYIGGSTSGTIERQQIRSMTSYSRGSRLNLALQLATERTDTGQVQHWEELQATTKLTARTMLRLVSSFPDIRDPQRFQAYLHQELPHGLAVQADYGRLSTYQPVLLEHDRSRFKVMLLKSFGIATPARGAEVSGRVLDNTGRGVAGARVKLGPYTTDTTAAGGYSFRHVPRGEYDLSLDPQLLPADFAWDGRSERVSVTPSKPRIAQNLHVTPLNSIHGRVYVDRNSNDRFDDGEGVAGVVVQVGDRLTVTDLDGAYSVYNLWPASYVVRLGALPSDFEASTLEQAVTLRDDAPVTGANVRVRPRVKPIIWQGAAK